jgi:hypothetical protein
MVGSQPSMVVSVLRSPEWFFFFFEFFFYLNLTTLIPENIAVMIWPRGMTVKTELEILKIFFT